jgi:CRISPR type III-A-associated protein Csm2
MADFHGGRPYRDDRRDAPPPPQAVKIGSFYKGKDEKGEDKVDPDLFDGKARALAKSIDGVTGTQLRRLFDEVKRYSLLLEASAEDEWARQEPYIRMIKSKTSYTVARQKEKANNADKGAYKNLAEFIAEGIDSVHSAKDYHIFVALFEAVYGFYYEIAPNKVRGNNA